MKTSVTLFAPAALLTLWVLPYWVWVCLETGFWDTIGNPWWVFYSPLGAGITIGLECAVLVPWGIFLWGVYRPIRGAKK